MRLHWFREHKQIVYYVLCPAIVLSMTIFGIGKFGSFTHSAGPTVSYTVGNKEVTLTPAETFQKRVVTYKFSPYYVPRNNANEDNPTTDNIGLRLAEVQTARDRGFEVGFEEFNETLRNVVKNKIMSIDNSAEEVKVNHDMYQKLLAQLDMTEAQFEGLIHELAVRQKLHGALMESIELSDQQLYRLYCETKEVVRIRYKLFKSDDFISKTKDPAAEAIKKFYDDHLTEKTGMQYKDIYMTQATLSLEAVAYKDDKIFANIPKPTADELKTFYDNNKAKTQAWQDPAKPGTFKPLEAVKAEAETMWHDDKVAALKRTVEANFEKALKDLTDAETKFKADAANKDKSFDVKAFAAANNLTYWVTPEQTEEKYKPGKFEVNAPDLNLAATIFGYARTTPGAESLAETQMRHMDEFTAFKWLDEKKPELGGIRARKKVYTAEKTKTLEEAKDKIVEHLKVLESAELVRKAADAQHDEWKRGENLPKLEDLDEVTSDKKENHPLVRNFRNNQKALGEVLDVADGRPETERFDFKDYDKKWCYVGCVVERRLPTLDGFKIVGENDWSRDEARHGTRSRYMSKPGMLDDDFRSELGLMVEQIKSNVIHIGSTETEPDVRTAFQNGRHDDY